MKAVVLLSGGLDSVCALYHAAAGHEIVSALSFDYGAKHNHRELPFAGWHADKLGLPHRVIELPFIGETFSSDLLKSGDDIPEGHYEEPSMKRTVVPFRNGIMLAVAGGYAESVGAEALVIAAHSGDHAIYPDCREPFMEAMATALREGTYAGIEILRPFIDWKKSDIVTRANLMNIDFTRTWSCYKGEDLHCGRCGTCVERIEAFRLAGVSDPTAYSEG